MLVSSWETPASFMEAFSNGSLCGFDELVQAGDDSEWFAVHNLHNLDDHLEIN